MVQASEKKKGVYMEMGVPGKRKRTKLRRRWTDNIREDMERAGVKDKDMVDLAT